MNSELRVMSDFIVRCREDYLFADHIDDRGDRVKDD
jgi:hypothetical protein